MTSSSSDQTLSKLCLSCGLCCDGTLFARVPVTPSERDRLLASRGIAVETRADGSLALPQRCAALNGCACTAYAERPARCREYQCNLYSAVEGGEVDLNEAIEVSRGAHERIAALGRAFFGEGDDGVGVVSRYRKLATDPTGPELSADARAAFAELNAYLDRHFRGRR